MQIVVLCEVNWFLEILVDEVPVSTLEQQSPDYLAVAGDHCQMERSVVSLLVRLVDLATPGCEIVDSILAALAKLMKNGEEGEPAESGPMKRTASLAVLLIDVEASFFEKVLKTGGSFDLKNGENQGERRVTLCSDMHDV